MTMDRTRSRGVPFLAVTLAVVGGVFMLLPIPLAVSTMNFARATKRDSVQPAAPSATDRARLSEAYGKLPLRFEANEGQSDKSVKFLSRGPGYSLFLTSTEVTFVLSRRPSEKSESPKASVLNRDAAVVRMQLRGANPEPEVTGVDDLPGKTNYFLGNDPAGWRTNVPTYAKVRYRGVYSGIDAIYYGSGGQLEYDFVVAPGADPRTIRLGFDGSEGVSIDANGDLLVEAGGQQIRLLKPVAYQNVMANRRAVAAEYALLDSGNIFLKVGKYDEREPLIIDPVVSYSTYLGGSLEDSANGIAVDGSGNAYITGGTFSINLTTVPTPIQAANGGGQDVFVAKLNPTGSALIYSTYLGGSGDDSGQSIAIDSSGNAYITGFTKSTAFPLMSAVYSSLRGIQDVFMAKLNAAGSGLLYSTYLGGDGDELGNNIAVDGSGNAYVVGKTSSTNFPTVNPKQATFGGGSTDGFLAKLNASGSAFVYATYLGGNSDDNSWAVAVDASENAYVVGATVSDNFPTAHALYPTFGGSGVSDAFVSKFSADGSTLTYSTYLGGSSDDYGIGVAVDGSGNVYVTGYTSSTDFPKVNPYQANLGGAYDVFVSKLNSAGSALLYSTYLGGSFQDIGGAIAIDASGNAYVVGLTNSTNFPTASPTQMSLAGGSLADAFVSKLSPTGSALLYSTYLGGNNTDVGFGIAVKSGNIYVVGFAQSTNFPTTVPLQPTFGGGPRDGFVTKITDTVLKKVRGQVISQ